MTNIFYYLFGWLIIMSFGKRVVKKVEKDVSNDSGNVKKSIDKSNSVNSSDNNINNNDNTSDISVNQDKIKKQSKKTSFLKKISKNKTSNTLLFNMTKEEKLELFIKNIKIIHPNIPKFWLNKEINKFKKKYNIE